MPRVSVWLIRAALLHLVSGALLGVAYLLLKATGVPAFAATHRPVHVEQMLIGWLVQLVIGSGFWILPRTDAADMARAAPRMWLVFWLLNLGVLAAALGYDPRLPSLLAPAGRLAEAAAVLLFAQHAWWRQRAYRATARTQIL